MIKAMLVCLILFLGGFVFVGFGLAVQATDIISVAGAIVFVGFFGMLVCILIQVIHVLFKGKFLE